MASLYARFKAFLARQGWLPINRVLALRQTGWLASVELNSSVDADGEPIPWITYGAISFLDQVVPTSASILEIGGGNSSRWWASRGNTVTVLEASSDWASYIRSAGITDVTILRDAEAVRAHLTAPGFANKQFDVVVVDGIAPRSHYLREAAHLVSDEGLLVLDNSDRVEFEDGLDGLLRFSRLDFFGMGPQNRYAWATSVFFRSAINPRGRSIKFSHSISY